MNKEHPSAENSLTLPPGLKLIDGGRDALERRALQLIVNGSHEEIMAAIETLKPRGKLAVAELSAVLLGGDPRR